jgi:hypothetical protein
MRKCFDRWRRLARICVLGLIMPPILVAAQDASPAREAEGNFLERAQEMAEDWWDKTQGAADEAWKRSRDYLRTPDDPDSFPQVWEGIVPRLEEARELEDAQDGLPENAWFGRDQKSNREDINQLLDQSIELLALSSAQRYRDRIGELEQAVAEAQARISEYRDRRVAAPREALVEKTVEDYDAAIQEQTTRIARYRAELQSVKQELAGELRAQGLEISDEQLEFMLSTVVGEDLLTMSVAFDNVKNITLQLEQLMVDSQEDLNSARRYYGMYTILLKILERMHQHVIDAIDQRYLKEIDGIAERTRSLLKETRRLQKRSPGDRKTLTSNIEAQELTLSTARFYRDYLIEQSRNVEQARRSIANDLAVAENTYETVKVSGELVGLMRSSQRLLNALIDRQVPVLRTFRSLEMKREFQKLTVQLRERSG